MTDADPRGGGGLQTDATDCCQGVPSCSTFCTRKDASTQITTTDAMSSSPFT